MTYRKEITLETRGRGTYEITDRVHAALRDTGTEDGLCTVFIHHTSASLIICENADPSVRRDLDAFFARLVPDGDPLFTHTAEGDDDMPAHVRTVLTQTSIGIPIARGRLDLGTWQGLYVWEHRESSHRRRISIVVSS
jgi:secondary thiamine-phosphate synthase enzyme